ncbi:hypothetical protein [Actinoplanes sp. NPDC051851]|uniref:hypothetical protein n=1 Tax=Actinoplanes sp. NPDC051851 TaxID=3154753 RepID=UPI003423C272
MASDLPAPTRHLLLTLAVLANWPGGIVPERYTKSLTGLAELTGMSRRSVMAHLNTAEKTEDVDGWVVRYRPTVARARAEKARTAYRLTIPARASAALAEQPIELRSRAGDAPENGPSRAGDAPELGQELPPSRAGAAHKPFLSSSSSSSHHAQTAIAGALGLEEEEADTIYRRIIAERKPIAPSRYINALIASGDIEQYRPTPAHTSSPTYTGPHCDFVDPGDGTDYCATCSGHRKHAKHRNAA